MPFKSIPLPGLRLACARYLEAMHANRRLTHDGRRQQFRHIPQRLWDRHSALLLEALPRQTAGMPDSDARGGHEQPVCNHRIA